jgi:hypothetical protein
MESQGRKPNSAGARSKPWETGDPVAKGMHPRDHSGSFSKPGRGATGGGSRNIYQLPTHYLK